MSADAFERGPWGLYGIWGGIIRTWLDELLPLDADVQCDNRVTLVINKPLIPVPLLPAAGPPLTALGQGCIERLAVSSFRDREDLISAAMASVHVPLFLDTRWTASFRGEACIDGSLVLGAREKLRLEMPPRFAADCQPLRLAPLHDPRMRAKYGSGWRDFLRLSSESGRREMFEWGELYVESLEANGKLLGQMKPIRARSGRFVRRGGASEFISHSWRLLACRRLLKWVSVPTSCDCISSMCARNRHQWT